jgi:hypothetical protein
VPALAEVQNVKVGGDLTVRAFHRENMDLLAESGTLDDEDDFIMSTIGLSVGADLTENISTFVRLASERDWDGYTSAADTADFALSQGSITIKELFYSPLTLRLGRQPIRWGRGFILGSNLLPGNQLDGSAANDDLHAAITANEYTDFTAFDAIRATLDLSNFGGINLPLTADYVYIKLDENAAGEDDDFTVQGLNLSTRFDQWSSEAETYVLVSRDEAPGGSDAAGACAAATGFVCEDGTITTMGVRGSGQPQEGTALWGELAYQVGTRTSDLEGVLASGSKHQAWAANLGLDHTFAAASMTPNLGGEWRFYSGKDNEGAAAGWFPIAPGYFTTAIREFQQRSGGTGFYPAGGAEAGAFATAVRVQGVTSGQTNQHEFGLFGGLKPMEDLDLDTRLSWFVMPVGSIPGAGGGARKHFVGTEWDTVLTYDYTDDVKFGFLYALFLPGSAFRDAGSANFTDAGVPSIFSNRSTAQQLVSTVSVKF